MGDIPQLKMVPDSEFASGFDPAKFTAYEVLQIFTLALAGTRDADGGVKLRAEAVMNSQFAKGMRRGYEDGKRDGYRDGYAEGLEDGRREALDKVAVEEAERATLKASARARISINNQERR